MSGLRIAGSNLRLIARRIDEIQDLIDDVGGLCLASGPSSAGLLGFDTFTLAPPFHLTIERGRFVHRVGHVIHTSSFIPLIDRTMVDDVPCTSATRTLFDLAPMVDAKRLTIALDSAIRDGLTTDDFLFRQLAARRSRGHKGTTAMLRVLEGAEIVRGGQSWLERAFLELIAGAGLPRPRTQQVLARRGDRLVRVDCHFPEADLVVELLGYRFHRSTYELQVAAERANALTLRGLRMIQFTYDHVVLHPAVVIATLREALGS